MLMKEFIYDKSAKVSILLLIIMVIIYTLGSLYFKSHFFFRTSIDGIDISCKTMDEAKNEVYGNVKDYKLKIKDKSGFIDVIVSDDINLQYEGNNKIDDIKKQQNSIWWVSSLIDRKDYNDIKLFSYDDLMLESRIKNLKVIKNTDIIEPKNPEFQYTDGKYVILEEIEGNKINYTKLVDSIKKAVETGNKEIDLLTSECYEKPAYTKESKEVKEAKEIMDKYVSSKIAYTFSECIETVDGSIINKWIYVDENMKPYIKEDNVKEYLKLLSEKYNTVGKERKFQSSIGKTVIVKGGHYGWKIDVNNEMRELIYNIQKGQSVLKEPLYSQKALSRGDDDIGDTYVEVNISRQHIWFYKEGKLIVQGDVVTGSLSKNTPTFLGVYGLNYKQKNATLKGAGYSSNVSYWMPFNGNIGLHDASWRSSFGGNIYKTNGTHGCVNMPKYVAKQIFENIDAGTPIVCYSEETKSNIQ